MKVPGIGNVGPTEATLFPPDLLVVVAIPYGAKPYGTFFFNSASFAFSASVFYSFN